MVRDIFKTTAMAFVNPVNTEGVMGKGLALEFKKRYPEAFREYEMACRHGTIAPGKCLMSWLPEPGPRMVIQFPTKTRWRSPSKYEYIDAGLVDLVRLVHMHGITSIAIPAMGCGLGQLDWRVVRKKIEAAFEDISGYVNIDLYDPQ